MTPQLLTHEALERALNLRDLSDPCQGPHAMQQIVKAIYEALASRWHCQRYLHRASPLLSVAENYDRLGYPPDGAARDARYTRYVTATPSAAHHDLSDGPRSAARDLSRSAQ